jgi:hypothetical protein
MTSITKPFYAHFEDEGVTTFDYRFDETVSTITVDAERGTVLVPGSESFIPGILNKTVTVLRHFFAEQKDLQFDYVVRSNASTVINFAQLLPTLGAQKVMYGSTLVQLATSVSEGDGNVAASYLPLRFAHGTCIILHRDAVRLLLEYEATLHRDTIDDLSIAMFFKDISRLRLAGFGQIVAQQVGDQFAYFHSGMNLHRAFAFRCRHYDSEDRKIDIEDITSATSALQSRFIDMPRAYSFVKNVFYHTQNITPAILLFCRNRGAWSTDGSNIALDNVFGDPAPGTPKVLLVELLNGMSLAQNTSWTFVLDHQQGTQLLAL